MTTYFARRLLLSIPTLIGITLVVFLVVALSPGGVGAAEQSSAGSAEPGRRALMQAYLDDRYGLDDPILVQYGRWLARISPLKFGAREQRGASGERLREPRRLAPPPLAGAWYDALSARGAPAEPVASAKAEDSLEARQAAYREAARAHAEARARYVEARLALEDAIRGVAREAEIKGATARDGSLRWAVLRSIAMDDSWPGAANVRMLGGVALESWREAERSGDAVRAALGAKPFDEVGVWIVPGWVSVGAPDLGMSFSRGRPVAALVASALPVTLLLNAIALPIMYLVAIPSGVLAASWRGSWFDRWAGGLFVALWSIPVVLAGVMLRVGLAHPRSLQWFPPSGLHSPDASAMPFLPAIDGSGAFQPGFLLDSAWHLCLPVACLVYGGFAVLSLQTRAAMIEQYSADYVRTARAKGLGPTQVALRHVLRNSLLPMITMFATVFPAMLSGSIVVERLFNIPGMGWLIIESILLRDREVLMANALMIAIVNLAALLLADLLYAAADPRISYE